MAGQRRVGTLTLGVFLVVLGGIFLVGNFVPLPYEQLLSLWPGIFILLGIEVLLGCRKGSEAPLRYDGGAVVLLIVLSLFGCVMAGAQCVLQYIRLECML